jgi:SAM-dependent methyltransferase
VRRAKKQKVHGTLAHLRYVNACFFEHIPLRCRKRVLYVGCGHGHDALLAILDSHVEEVVGVDPYEGGGNDDEDCVELKNLSDEYARKHRFTVERIDCETYLENVENEFDLIVAADVLHHIFSTSQPLRSSPLYPRAVDLFRSFFRSAKPHGVVAVSEVHRNGLRPFLKRHGVLKGHVHYRTKQNSAEWCRPALDARWQVMCVKNYVTYAFRSRRRLWGGLLGRRTLCDRYFIYLKKRG